MCKVVPLVDADSGLSSLRALCTLHPYYYNICVTENCLVRVNEVMLCCSEYACTALSNTIMAEQKPMDLLYRHGMSMLMTRNLKYHAPAGQTQLDFNEATATCRIDRLARYSFVHCHRDTFDSTRLGI
ncbi:hypothetical protein HD806DRAFT_97698 [Xylariaceae sp. AK1471]|nr:hypothetical protein HD806DRAFT_97698 [Xylariaceae sp. AK1471]